MATTITDLTLTLPANFIAGTMVASTTVGTGARTATHRTVALPKVAYSLWSGSGSQLDQFNILADVGGTLTNVTPGTTDVANVDLQALSDLAAQTKVAEELVFFAALNFGTTDAGNIYVMPHATNGWTAPFLDMTTPADGKLRVPPGHTDPGTGEVIPGILILASGNLASMPASSSNKVLQVKLSTGAASAEYRIVVAGRSADS
jgi:hypothetical protein